MLHGGRNPRRFLPLFLRKKNTVSESSHTPSPIRNGKLYTFFVHWIRNRSNSCSITRRTLRSNSAKNQSVFPCALMAMRGRLTEVKLRLPLP